MFLLLKRIGLCLKQFNILYTLVVFVQKYKLQVLFFLLFSLDLIAPRASVKWQVRRGGGGGETAEAKRNYYHKVETKNG